MVVLENHDFSSLKYLSASFIATYCSGLVHPLDVVKTRLQSNANDYSGHDGKSKSENLVPKYGSIHKALKYIYRDEGLRGLYKGFYVSLLCQAGAMSLFFWLYPIHYPATKPAKHTSKTKVIA